MEIQKDEDVITLQQELTGTVDEIKVKSEVAKRLVLDFFGSITHLFVKTQREVQQWEYFFKDFVSYNQDKLPDHKIWLSVDDSNDSFIESIFRKDYTQKSIYSESGEKFVLYSRFKYWSSIESPIPPFHSDPLNQELLLLHASAAKLPAYDSGILFLAPPYQGKTTLANAVVKAGGFPLADNTAVLRSNKLTILPYLTPTGIREETINKMDGLQDAIINVPDSRVTISEVTGKVYLLHFDEIYKFSRPHETTPRFLIYPNNLYQSGMKKHNFQRIADKDLFSQVFPYVIDTGIDKERKREAIGLLTDNTRSLILNYDLQCCDVESIIDDLCSLTV